MQASSPDSAGELHQSKVMMIVVIVILLACALAIVWNVIRTQRRQQARKAELARQKLAVMQRGKRSAGETPGTLPADGDR
jgi:type II secretory pathway pseudopilin PulG